MCKSLNFTSEERLSSKQIFSQGQKFVKSTFQVNWQGYSQMSTFCSENFLMVDT
jgi:hypothetical protein